MLFKKIEINITASKREIIMQNLLLFEIDCAVKNLTLTHQNSYYDKKNVFILSKYYFISSRVKHQI